MTNQEVVEEINSLVRDDEVKNWLFDTKFLDFDNINSNIVKTVNKLIHLLFYVFYSSYLDNNISDNIAIFQNPRVKKNFEKLFKTQKLNIDFMFFIITELQIDSNISEAQNCMHILNNSFSYQYWKRKVKFTFKSSRSINGKSKELESLILTLRSTPLLKILKIKTNDTTGSFEFSLSDIGFPEIIIDSYNMIYLNEEDNYYYSLYNMKVINDVEYVPIYKVLSNDPLFQENPNLRKDSKINFMIDFLYRKVAMKKQDSLLMNNLYGDRFDKIRILALSISDILRKMEGLRFKVSTKYLYDEQFLTKIGLHHLDDEDGNKNWDNIITILLIEIGPSELLYELLDDSEIIFEFLMNNISNRLNDEILKTQYMNKYVSEKIKLLKRLNSNKLSTKKLLDIFLKDYEKLLMVKTIINYISKDCEDVYPNIVESIIILQKQYNEIVCSSTGAEEKIIKIGQLFERTFKFILVFYAGVIAYSKKHLNLTEKREENKSKSPHLNEEFTQINIQKECEEQFKEASKKKWKEIKKKRLTLGMAFGEFRNLAKSTYKIIDKNSIRISPDGYALEKTIGRYSVCNMEKFSSIVDGTENRLGFNEILIQVKHGPDAKTSIREYNKNDLEDFFERGLDLLMYLTNNGTNSNYHFSKSISFTPVFPFVMQFSMNTKTKDGYSVSSYSVKSIDNKITNIKFLSAKQHQEHENYYCIPNASSSTDVWWIEPFFIRCDLLDDIFKSEIEEDESEEL